MNAFKTARIKLTAWYLLIIMFISLSFSAILYQIVSLEITRFAQAQRFRFDQRFLLDEELLAESQQHLFWSLVEINGIILVVSGSLGYLLAGKTLFPIQKIVEEQKRFVGDASHELRTPLTALKSMLEVSLRDKKITLKEARSIIGDSLEETDKLTLLSNSLLELARLDGDARKLIKEKLFVKDLVVDSLKQVSLRAKTKNISISSSTNGTQILGNREKLIETLVILLDNALKYSPSGSQISISAKAFKNSALIKVSDHGVGISPADLPRIFERFYRIDSSRSRQEEGGYGLGLAIAQKIVEEHHGKIEVESELGKGSEFKITFPSFS
jgi:signal transduction histidine kinase